MREMIKEVKKQTQDSFRKSYQWVGSNFSRFCGSLDETAVPAIASQNSHIENQGLSCLTVHLWKKELGRPLDDRPPVTQAGGEREGSAAPSGGCRACSRRTCLRRRRGCMATQERDSGNQARWRTPNFCVARSIRSLPFHIRRECVIVVVV